MDWSVLDDLVQKPIRSDINVPLSIHEFEQVIKKIILHKIPGSSGVSPNAIRALNIENNFFNLKYATIISKMIKTLMNDKKDV